MEKEKVKTLRVQKFQGFCDICKKQTALKIEKKSIFEVDPIK